MTSSQARARTWNTAGVTEQILTDNGTVQSIKATVAAGPGPCFVRLRVVKQLRARRTQRQ